MYDETAIDLEECFGDDVLITTPDNFWKNF
jgi:hypothetical protein